MDEATKREIHDSPTAWFAALERARNTGNRNLLALARRNLTRLGVHVVFEADEIAVSDRGANVDE